MTPAILLLGHGVVGALALPTVWLKEPWRARVLMALCLLGAGLGVALVVLNGSLEEWRTAHLTGTATVVGTAAAASWLIALVTSGRAGGALTCSLLGIAISSLGLAVTNQWVVPALLFWVCSSLAIAALASQGRAGIWVWGLLFSSDVALTAALVGNWVDTTSWLLPDSLDGWRFYVVLVAAGVRAGVVPALGTWGFLGRPGAPAIPLLTGGAFALLPFALGGEGDPWSGVALFTMATGLATLVLVARRLHGRMAFAAAVPIAALLGLAVVAPSGLVPAGLAAVVAAGSAAAWVAGAGEPGPERVVALTALPPTLAFIAAVTGAAAAVEHTVTAEEVIDKVPWTLVLVLAPVAVTATVALAAHLISRAGTGSGWLARARRGEAGALALLVTRIVLLFALAGALVPGDWLGIASPVAEWEERRAALFGAALVLAAGAAFWSARRSRREIVAAQGVPLPAGEGLAVGTLEAPRAGSLTARLLTVLTLLLAVAVIATVGWLTFEGLRLGFL